ncbi:MAG TPA: LuxR C-terminal-related transcriptional regulator [Solirubrobacteraceae bacterium]
MGQTPQGSRTREPDRRHERATDEPTQTGPGYAPPVPRSAVARPELFDRLDHGIRGPLTLVTGAPGSGKTLLLTTWLAARPPSGPVAWVSLEPMHGRPAHFWHEFLTVLDESSEVRLPPVADGSTGHQEEFVAGVAKALAGLPEPLVLVFDDFERLQSREVTEGLDRLLRLHPRQLRLVIASRLDPGLSLQRRRLEGGLAEIRSTDLALTRSQAGELFALAGLELTDVQVDKLHERTEGWAGGLRLAALSLQGHPDPDGFVRTFAGHERTIADYLLEEVLQQQPAEVCEFMLRTSVVERLEAGLADALTGRDDGARMLDRLERDNAFLVPLDQHRHWYRYHPMFAELLRNQLRYRMPDAFALEHRRAARWFASHGMAAAAVGHALTAGDVKAATELLAQHWLTLVVDGEAEALVGGIEALPRPVVAGSAELALAGAGALLEVGDLHQAEHCLELCDARAGTVPAKRRAQHTLFRAVVKMLAARLRGDFASSQYAAHRVLTGHQLGALPDEARALAVLHLGVAESWTGSSREARQHLEAALELGRREGRDYLVLSALSRLALLKALDGGLRDSAGFGQEASRIAARHGWDEQAAAAPAYLGLAITNFYRADPAAAGDYLELAGRAAARSQERTTRCLIDLMRALLLAGTDGGEAARIAHTVASNATDWALPPSLAARARAVEAGSLALSGEVQRARETLEGRPLMPAWVEFDLVAARLALADGDPAEALRRLQPDLVGNPVALHPGSAIEARALAGLAKHLLHDDQGALDLLEEALSAAQPQGYHEPLLAVGAPLRDLLKRRVRAGTAQRALAGDLIGALEQQQGLAEDDYRHLLLDPLSGREEAVMRYLPTLMSKAEIASELFVSVNTVKTHTKNIYRKLGVGTRTEAVRRARSLHLV